LQVRVYRLKVLVYRLEVLVYRLRVPVPRIAVPVVEKSTGSPNIQGILQDPLKHRGGCGVDGRDQNNEDAECEGPEAGLAQIDAVLEQGELANYYLAHSARADMYRRLGRTAEARASYEKALALTRQEPERQFLARRLEELKQK
jgi:hypothetical protein